MFELAARCERAARHHDVLRHDLSYELHQRDVGELGGAPHTILADWLRVTQQYLKRREGP